MIEIRSYYGKRPRGVALVTCGRSMAKQEFVEESDINHIMARYLKFGTVPPNAQGVAQYGDFSEVGDLLEAQTTVGVAADMFAALPSKVRERFANDPVRLVAFLADEKNYEEALALGLVNKRPEVSVSPPVVEEKKAVDTEKKA